MVFPSMLFFTCCFLLLSTVPLDSCAHARFAFFRVVLFLIAAAERMPADICAELRRKHAAISRSQCRNVLQRLRSLVRRLRKRAASTLTAAERQLLAAAASERALPALAEHGKGDEK